MAFSWNTCAVISNSESKRIKSEYYRVIYEFKEYLTPKIIEGLEVWVSNNLRIYGRSKIKAESIRGSIIELLEKCCNADNIKTLEKADVIEAESEILIHIQKAIRFRKYKGIYIEHMALETAEEYKKRQIMTPEKVKEYLEGVPIFD